MAIVLLTHESLSKRKRIIEATLMVVCVYVGQIVSIVLHLGVTWISYSVAECIHPYGEYGCLCVCVRVRVCVCECVCVCPENPFGNLYKSCLRAKLSSAIGERFLLEHLSSSLMKAGMSTHKLLRVCAPKLVNTHARLDFPHMFWASPSLAKSGMLRHKAHWLCCSVCLL